MNPYTGWITAVQDTEDATARALRARDRLGALRIWLTWQIRRCRIDPDDGAAALDDVDAGIDAAELLLLAARAHRGSLSKPEA